MSIPPGKSAHLTGITTFTSFRQSLHTQFKSRNFGSWKLTSHYAESAVQSKSVVCSVECFSTSLPATIRGKFAWLGNHPSFANGTRASVDVAKARCKICSSKPCWLYTWPIWAKIFAARNHTVVVLPVLRATLVLPLARVPLLKL